MPRKKGNKKLAGYLVKKNADLLSSYKLINCWDKQEKELAVGSSEGAKLNFLGANIIIPPSQSRLDQMR